MNSFIHYKNAKISFSDVGSGTAALLLHGFLENKSMWSAVSNSLLTTNRVITIDLLGHGESDCLGYVHTMEECAAAVNAVLKHLRIRRFVLVGHSLGGYVSLALAEQYPEKIKGLCLLNSTATADDAARKLLRTRAVKMAQSNYENLVRMSFVNLFSEASKKDHADELAAALEEALKTSVQGYVAASEGMKARKDKTAFLERAKFKKLFIIGESDPILDAKQMQKEAAITNSECVVLSEGHMSHIENKQELNIVLKDFIKVC